MFSSVKLWHFDMWSYFIATRARTSAHRQMNTQNIEACITTHLLPIIIKEDIVALFRSC